MPTHRNIPGLTIALALGSLTAPQLAEASGCSPTVVTANTIINANTGCSYTWQAGNITVNANIDDTDGVTTDGLIDTDGLMGGTLTINAGKAILANDVYGIYVHSMDTVTTILNNGSVTGSPVGLYNDGTINELVNNGLINGDNVDINNQGVLGSFTNRQRDLKYRGDAPSSYDVYISSPSQFGTLLVTGSPNWAVSALDFGIATGSTVAGATTYQDVIQNGDPDDPCEPRPGSGPLAGCDRRTANIAFTTFDSTTTKTGSYAAGGKMYDFSLVFDGMNFDLVVAELAREGLTESAVFMGNSKGVGAALVIDGSDELLALFDDQETTEEMNDALTQTLPLLTGGAQGAAQGAMGGINRVVQARIEGNRGLSSGSDYLGDQYLWLKPFSSWADQGNRSGVAGFQGDTVGAVLGYDAASSTALRLGGALAYARVDLEGRDGIAPQDADITVYQLIGYGSYNVDPRTDINFQVDVGLNRTDGKRRIGFLGMEAKSDYDTFTTHVGVGIGRTLAIAEQTTFTPALRADYTWLEDDSYRESGAGLLNLNVDDNSTNAFVTGVDGKLSHSVSEEATVFASLGVGYDALDERASIRSQFAGAPGAAFRTKGMHGDPWSSRGGLGAVYATADGMELSLRFDAERDQKFLNQTLSFRARWAF